MLFYLTGGDAEGEEVAGLGEGGEATGDGDGSETSSSRFKPSAA